jgi:hypothetical protein
MQVPKYKPNTWGVTPSTQHRGQWLQLSSTTVAIDRSSTPSYTWADEARPGTPGTGDCSCYCLGSGTSGSVLAAAGDVATTCYSAAVTWLPVACLHCYSGHSSAALAADRSACHHYSSDSNCIAQWASESGTACSSVCHTYKAGVSVVCFTKERVGSALYSFSHGLYSYSVHFSANGGHPCL